MQIKYQEKGYGNMSGSSLLRQMQNEHSPSLDLLIRESVQNSLDAALPDAESVLIEITTGSFLTERLSPFFQGIESQLNDSYPGTNQFLSIQDSGTYGLTGPLSLADIEGFNFGNLQKLIYQIAKSQENEGSGGSWGIGKTVYFRIGIGLVIYYSRIYNQSTGQYEERMAATAVENEEKPILLTGNPNNTGIAWWGRKDTKPGIHDGTIPVVDDPEIHQILEVFGLHPMKGTETGTLVILPYINSDSLLNQTKTEMEIKREIPTPYWKSSLEECMNIIIQRWYCPRLDNTDFEGPCLQCTINGKSITRDSFQPIFRLMQNLYNHRPESKGTFHNKIIESEKIILRDVFDSSKGTASAGILSFLNVSKKDMDMLPPENELGPYADIDREEAEAVHEPILAYTRKPGMIVSYETDSDWTHSMPRTEKSEFIVGIFKSDRTTVLSENLRMDKMQTLEDYLRKSENADHMSWTDINLGSKRPTIVNRIKSNIKNKISKRYKDEKSYAEKKKNIELGRKLGALLLPAEGTSYWDDLTGGSSGPGGIGGDGETNRNAPGKGSENPSSGFGIELNGSPEYTAEEIRIPIMLNFGNQSGGDLSVLLRTESGKVSPSSWQKDTGSEFPVRINALEIQKIESGKKKSRKSKGKGFSVVDPSVRIGHSDVFMGIQFQFLQLNESSPFTSVRIIVPSQEYYCIQAVISYSVYDFEGILEFNKITNDKVAQEETV